MDTRTSETRLRIERVRDAIRRHGVAALLVPSSDPHLSEYLPERWQGRQWLSGFTGSMGTLAVTLDRAALFTDSRYWLQAELQLAGSGIELVRLASAAATTHIDWLLANLTRGSAVAVDGAVFGLAGAQALRAKLESAGIVLRTELDVLGDAWPDRPGLPTEPVYEHRPPYATRARATRLAEVRAAMAQAGATHHFVSTVDDIAWITNLRGSDVSYNPVFAAHLLIERERATLFIAPGKVDETLRSALVADGVSLATYDVAGDALASLPPGSTLLVDPRRVTLAFRERASADVSVVEQINPSTLAKSRKNADEVAHIREVMAEDGAALCEFYAWFERALGRETITELTIDERITAARAKRAGFVGPSFSTIAGFNANGALPHYRATRESHAAIEGNGLLLIDSGGQYLGGTTDITRVWKVGDVSDVQRLDFTLVLKGTMALSRARFARGTLGPMLDAIARAPLWEHGLDFGHGTGHGVGYFLNVHEGPQSISRTVPEPTMAMEPGMVTSIEPGVYREGQWGIRIENLVLNVPATTPEAGRFGEILEFETLTLCPIDTRCIDLSLLRPDEVAWLNAYHTSVRQRLRSRVGGAALAWLEARTYAL